MAKIIRRTWTSDGPLGKKVRHVSFGYTLTVNGKRERKFSSAWLTEGAAHEALTKRLKDVEAGRIERAQPQRTLEQLKQEYLIYKRSEGKLSVKDDQRILEHRLLPYFSATLPVRGLRSDMIARFEKERIGAVSLFTVANELSVLRHMLHKAKKWGYLETVPDFDLPKRPEGRERYATQDEIQRLIQAAEQSNNRELTAVIVLAINTGLRRGSLRSLTWEQVDLGQNFGLTPKLTLERTKNGKPHGVPLNKDAVDALCHMQPDPAKRSGLVFREGFDEAFKGAVTRAKIVDLRFHDLRHTNASTLLNAGRSLKEVQEILGHRDFRMTLRYAHLSKSHLVSAVTAIEGIASLPKENHKAVDDRAHKMAQSGSHFERKAVTY